MMTLEVKKDSICAICKKTGSKERLWTIRTSWIDAGGFGYIPPEARVHITCDNREQNKLKGLLR